ncbi:MULTISPECIES: hypothetical protein [unclassified Pseudomonas]|uniref:hypothetical protein n=1 Tax=unclassified Pseudomonas TaxID=196821 RepID=UPI0011A47A16|nr:MULTISPECIES: hypothetical protein [unclassified Pseudomonas]
MNTRHTLLSILIFPLAPIAVIIFTHVLCYPVWYASFYVPGEDGGEAEPAMALISVPLLLIVISLLLGFLTVLARWLPRWLTALLRVPLAGVALLLSLISTLFFMGQPLAVLNHWQVALAWLAWSSSALAFVWQQWQRIRG